MKAYNVIMNLATCSSLQHTTVHRLAYQKDNAFQARITT